VEHFGELRLLQPLEAIEPHQHRPLRPGDAKLSAPVIRIGSQHAGYIIDSESEFSVERAWQHSDPPNPAAIWLLKKRQHIISQLMILSSRCERVSHARRRARRRLSGQSEIGKGGAVMVGHSSSEAAEYDARDTAR